MAHSAGYHEPFENLTVSTIEMHRALTSLQEELEAVDWYQQRVDSTTDSELEAILAHNRDEEKEHAVMLLEWIRRRDPVFDANMREYLFTSGSLTAHEEEAMGGSGTGGSASSAVEKASPPRPSIGSLKGEV